MVDDNEYKGISSRIICGFRIIFKLTYRIIIVCRILISAFYELSETKARWSSCKNTLFLPKICDSAEEAYFSFKYFVGDDDDYNPDYCEYVNCPVVMSSEFAEKHLYCSQEDSRRFGDNFGRLSNGMGEPEFGFEGLLTSVVFFLLAADVLQDILRKVIRRGSNEKYAFLTDPSERHDGHKYGAGCLRTACAVNTIVFGLHVEYLLRFCPSEEERHSDQFFVENANMAPAWGFMLFYFLSIPPLCLFYGLGAIGTGGALLSYICNCFRVREGSGAGADNINKILRFMIGSTFNICIIFQILLVPPILWNTFVRDGGNGIGQFFINVARVPGRWEDLLGGFSFISIAARVACEVALVYLGWLLGEGLPSVLGRCLGDEGGKRSAATANALELSGAVL